MDSSGFIPGVWCGVILGSAVMLLIVSLISESSQRKQKRQMPRVHWSDNLTVATVLGRRSDH